MTYAEQISSRLNVKLSQVTAAINLPDDEQLRLTADELTCLRTFDERRATNGSVNCRMDHSISGNGAVYE